MDLQDVIWSTLVIGWLWMIIWQSKTSKESEKASIALKQNKELLINEKLASLRNATRKLLFVINGGNLTCAQKSLVFSKFLTKNEVLELIGLPISQFSLLEEIYAAPKRELVGLKTNMSSEEKKEMDIVNIHGIDIQQGMASVANYLKNERSVLALHELVQKGFVTMYDNERYEAELTQKGLAFVNCISNISNNLSTYAFLSNLGPLRGELGCYLNDLCQNYFVLDDDEYFDEAYENLFKDIDFKNIRSLLCENLSW